MDKAPLFGVVGERLYREMKNGRQKLLFIISSTLLAGYPYIGTSDVSCGQALTENTTLQADVICQGSDLDGITFGASYITLDLGGHSIIGLPATGDNYARGVIATEKKGITIKNGTMKGFDAAVFLSMAPQSKISNMTFQDPRVIAVQVNQSDDVVVENSFFNLPVFATANLEVGAIGVEGSFVRVNNIEVRDGAIGVAFGFSQVSDCANGPSNGAVLQSTFTQPHFSAIYINCSTDVQIRDNEIAGVIEVGGVEAVPPYLGAITGLMIENNTIRNSPNGITFSGATDSMISNNTVLDTKWYGISMRESEGCRFPVPGWECFYSTGNVISDNKVLNSGNADLMHHPLATGNNWLNNVCVTWEGSEIKRCIGVGLPWLPLLLN